MNGYACNKINYDHVEINNLDELGRLVIIKTQNSMSGCNDPLLNNIVLHIILYCATLIFMLSGSFYNKFLGSNKQFPLWNTGNFIPAQSIKVLELRR